MMKQMEAEGFGNCTNQYECEAACPKGISVDNIARLNRDFIVANTKEGIKDQLQTYLDNGIDHMLALRGDIPFGWTGTNGDLHYATANLRNRQKPGQVKHSRFPQDGAATNHKWTEE